MSLLTQLAGNLLLWLLLIGLAALWLSRRQRSLLWVSLVLAAACLLCTRPVAELLTRPLETRHAQSSIADLQRQGVKQVVVLTGGGYPERRQTLSSALPHGSVYRLLGGLELCARLGPECRLIFSGSAGRSSPQTATAETMGKLARLLDPDREIASEAISSSTADHAGNIEPLVAGKPFALVTSAYHMPRSLRSFRRYGLDPIPYPVDFLAHGGYGWTDVLPSADAAWTAQVAFREYLAWIFYGLTGR